MNYIFFLLVTANMYWPLTICLETTLKFSIHNFTKSSQILYEVSAFRKGVFRKGNRLCQSVCHKQVVAWDYPKQLCFSSLQIFTEEKYGSYRAFSPGFSMQYKGEIRVENKIITFPNFHLESAWLFSLLQKVLSSTANRKPVIPLCFGSWEPPPLRTITCMFSTLKNKEKETFLHKSFPSA